jgi:hypothetical protein
MFRSALEEMDLQPSPPFVLDRVPPSKYFPKLPSRLSLHSQLSSRPDREARSREICAFQRSVQDLSIYDRDCFAADTTCTLVPSGLKSPAKN